MKKIPLTQGYFAIVDDEDYPYLSKYNWQISSGKYAKTGIKGYFMHRVIMKAPPGFEIDHINRDKLDNRKENLRFVNRSQNTHNVGKRKDSTSGYKGVNYHKPRKCWVARIQVNGKRYFLGGYKTKEEAIMAYMTAQMVYGY